MDQVLWQSYWWLAALLAARSSSVSERRATSCLHRAIPSTRDSSSRNVSTPAHVTRVLPSSHDFFLLTIVPISPHRHAQCDTQLLPNAKSSTCGIAHRSFSAGAVSPLCDILPQRFSALSVARVNVQDLTYKAIQYCTCDYFTQSINEPYTTCQRLRLMFILLYCSELINTFIH